MEPTTPIASRRTIEVRFRTYSPAARPSRQRAAPAKKRQTSAQEAISPVALATSLPTFEASIRPSSSRFASMTSAMARSLRARWPGVDSDQRGKAFSAAWTARSTSASPAAGASATTSPLAGL